MAQTKEEILEYGRKWREKNREHTREYSRQYRQEHPDHVQVYNREYKADHKEEAKVYMLQYRQDNKEAIAQTTKNWQIQNKDRIKACPSNSPKRRMGYHRKYAYGLTDDEFSQKIKSQDGRCKICNRPFYEECGAPCVDHDHETEKVRDLLCHNCNRALGLFKESIKTLRTAIQYLEKHKE